MAHEHAGMSNCLLHTTACLLLQGDALSVQIGLLEKAQDLYARAYDIQTAKLRPEHPEVAHTMNYTAGLLKAMGKYSDAESVYRAVSLSPSCRAYVCRHCHLYVNTRMSARMAERSALHLSRSSGLFDIAERLPLPQCLLPC